MSTPEKTSNFNKVSLHDCDAEDVVRIIFSGELGRGSYIVTPNVDHFFRLDTLADERFNQAYANSDITVCDSRIVRAISCLEANPISKVCPGSDLTEKLLSSPKIKSKPVLIIGSHPELVKKISSRYGIEEIECYSPPMGFIKDPAEFKKCVSLILSCNAEIVFLAVGSPQQEILASAAKSAITAESSFNGVMLCVGASLDFLTGVTKRAPVFIQKLHLEWLHRALSDPLRLVPRYISNFQWLVGYIFKSMHSKIFTRH